MSLSDPDASEPLGGGPPAASPPRRLPSGERMLAAARIRSEAAARAGEGSDRHAFTDAVVQAVRAEVPVAMQVRGAGGELVPADGDTDAARFKNTLANPDYVAVDASRDRLQLARRAGVLNAALDAADTIEAENSLEMMLAHQMAAMHHTTMVMAEQANRRLERVEGSNLSYHDIDVKIVEAATKLTNAVARSSLAFQQGLLALQKLRSGNSQRIVVQHVTVADGGQAVVAGEMQAGGAGTKRKRTKGEHSQIG